MRRIIVGIVTLSIVAYAIGALAGESSVTSIYDMGSAYVNICKDSPPETAHSILQYNSNGSCWDYADGSLITFFNLDGHECDEHKVMAPEEDRVLVYRHARKCFEWLPYKDR